MCGSTSVLVVHRFDFCRVLFLLMLLFLSSPLLANYCDDCGKFLDNSCTGKLCAECALKRESNRPASMTDSEAQKCAVCYGTFVDDGFVPGCYLDEPQPSNTDCISLSNACCMPCCDAYVCSACLHQLDRPGLVKCPKCRGRVCSTPVCCFPDCDYKVDDNFIDHLLTKHSGFLIQEDLMLPAQVYKEGQCQNCGRVISSAPYGVGRCLCNVPRECFSCIECGESCSTRSAAEDHYRKRHLPEKFVCCLCSRHFCSREDARTHMVEHCFYACPFVTCRRRFETLPALLAHIASRVIKSLFSQPSSSTVQHEVQDAVEFEVNQVGTLASQLSQVQMSEDERLARAMQQAELDAYNNAYRSSQEVQQPVQAVSRPVQASSGACMHCFYCWCQQYHRCPHNQ